ncbi:MAG: hypothetical protein MI723_15005 [Caulobacterales bacterium]|nr:hypothetical protein [Caulobacterales bacterium]
MTPSIDALKSLEGRVLPGDDFMMSADDARRLSDAVAAPPAPDGLAHPIALEQAIITGMGVSLEEVFGWMGAAASDGPLLGEVEMTHHAPLRTNVAYRVRGRVDAVARKHGGTLLTFDTLTLRFEVVDPDGAVAGEVLQRLLFPRRAP